MHKDEQDRPQSASIIGEVITSIVSGEATSRARIARLTGYARSTVSQQVERLLEIGLVDEGGYDLPTRGRPPRVLRVSPRAGSVAVVDVDTVTTRMAVADLSGRIRQRTSVSMPVDRGPAQLLDAVCERLLALLAEAPDTPLRQVVVGLPAPVDFRRGRAVRPPIMPGWDGYPVSEQLQDRLGAPVIVDNDVNLAALGEAAQDYADTPLLVVKVATGVGAGLVTASGEVHRGADGAAGDIGHIRTAGNDDVECRCGQRGCLEAVASLAAAMRALGIDDDNLLSGVEVLRERARSGDTETMRVLRHCAEEIGEVVAALVQMFNPRTLVLTGPLSEGHDEILSGVRGVVYQRAVPLTTRELTLTTSHLGTDAEIIGGVELALQQVWSPAGVDRMLSS